MSSHEFQCASQWESIWTPLVITPRTDMSQVARVDPIFAIPRQVVECFHLCL
jgi:hypothetical protein